MENLKFLKIELIIENISKIEINLIDILKLTSIAISSFGLIYLR